MSAAPFEYDADVPDPCENRLMCNIVNLLKLYSLFEPNGFHLFELKVSLFPFLEDRECPRE